MQVEVLLCLPGLMNTIHLFPQKASNKSVKMKVDTVGGQEMVGASPFLYPLNDNECHYYLMDIVCIAP